MVWARARKPSRHTLEYQPSTWKYSHTMPTSKTPYCNNTVRSLPLLLFFFLRWKKLQKWSDLQQNSWQQESFTSRVTANMKFPPKHWGFTASALTEPTHTSLQAPLWQWAKKFRNCSSGECVCIQNHAAELLLSWVWGNQLFQQESHINMSIAKVLNWFLAPQKLLLHGKLLPSFLGTFYRTLSHIISTDLGHQTRAR